MANEIEYFDKQDTLFLVTLLHGVLADYVKAVEGKQLSTEDFTTELKTKLDGIDLDQYSTTEEMNDAISDALKDVTGISFAGPYETYEKLVETVTEPKNGVIYLVTSGGDVPNTQDEYFWNGSSFEKFGSTSLDLSEYVKKTNLKEITTDELQAIWDSVFTS